MNTFTRSRVRTVVASVGVAVAGLLSVPGMVAAQSVTRGDLEKREYKCERAGIGGWLCVKASDRWLCPNDPTGDCIHLPRVDV
jgi:hypothetical protein